MPNALWGLSRALRQDACITRNYPTHAGTTLHSMLLSAFLSSLQQRQVSPPFGAKVLAQVLHPKGERFPEGKAVEGRLLFWDHLQDKSSYLLVTDPENPDDFDPLSASPS